MSDRTKWILAVLVALGLGFAGGRFAAPTKKVVTVEEKVVTATLYASHEQFAKRESKKASGSTVTVTKPDGTVIEATGWNWQHDSDLSLVQESVALGTSVAERKSETVTENARPSWAVEVGGAWNLSQPQLVPDQYWVQGQIRVPFLPVWVGAGAMKSDKWRPAFSARVEF